MRALLLVTAVGLAGYAGSFQVPLQFDDLDAIVAKANLRPERIDLDALARAAEGFPAGRWLANLTFALNHAAGGLSPFGFHLVNLAFHVGAALLVFLLARRLLGLATDLGPEARGRVALLAAALFAAHPVHTQAVTYVVQRMTSMGAFFALLSVLLFLRGRQPCAGRPGLALAGAALAAFAAFSCKENYAVLPALLLGLEALLFPGLAARLRARWGAALAAATALAVLGGLALWRYADTIAREAPRYGLTAAERLLTQGRVLVHYLSLLALPLPGRLHVDYAWTPSRSLLEPATTIPALLAVASLVALGVALRRRAPLLALAVLWFLVTLSVEQSVLPIDLVFEHRLYLPSVGPLLLAAWGLWRLTRGAPWAFPAVGGALVLLLAGATHLRNVAWSDPLLLWGDEASVGPGHARALLNLADAHRQQGRPAEARALLERAVRLEPDDPSAYVNLGVLAAEAGDAAEAERWFRQAVAVQPQAAPAWSRLGTLLLDGRRPAEALEAFGRALALDPSDVWASVNQGQALRALGRPAEARRSYDEALRREPALAVAWLDRALAFQEEGRPAEAASDAMRAAALDPADALAACVAGEGLAALGRRSEAEAWFRRALALDPRSRRARAGLATLAGAP